MSILKPRHHPDHAVLHVKWETRRNAVWIKLLNVKSFRLKEHLMAILRSKTLDLVLNRRAVTRAYPLDHSGIHRRTVEVGQDELMHLLRCARDPAGHLPWVRICRANQRKIRNGIQIPPLLLAAAEIN